MADAPLVAGISCHSWSQNKTFCALCPNNNDILIYDTKNAPEDSSKWVLLHTLSEHAGLVSGIDWCHSTNQIVSCSHDRNAYVWNYDAASKTWKPTLVILRINRAATAVKWSPYGNKFAVACGSKQVPVCYYMQANNFWVPKIIKKHKSTVTSLDWCPNNKFLVTGSCDGKARVFSAYMEGLDAAEDDGFGDVFGNKMNEFGEMLAEFDQAGAWVNSVAWSPAGFRLAFAGHGSTLHFVQLLAGSTPMVQTVNLKELPFLDMKFLDNNRVVGVGFDMNPALFSASGDEGSPVWAFKEQVDKKTGAKAAPAASAPSSSAFGGARAMFSDAATRGVQFGQKVEEADIKTRHKNYIMNLVAFYNSEGVAKQFSTVGVDGRICSWTV